jgi:hypothetical protein
VQLVAIKNPYKVINFIFLGVILIIFFYAALFSPEENNYPIQSDYTRFTSKPSISTGLSHGFSSIIRGDLGKAKEFNLYSIRLFSFFVIQLMMRMGVLVYNHKIDNGEWKIVSKVDAVVSSVMFLIFFYPFLADMF